MIQHRMYMRESLRILSNSAAETPEKVDALALALNLNLIGVNCRVKLLELLLDTQKKMSFEFR